jgi:hypothetical protein
VRGKKVKVWAYEAQTLELIKGSPFASPDKGGLVPPSEWARPPRRGGLVYLLLLAILMLIIVL